MGRILTLFALVLTAACAQPTAPAVEPLASTAGTDPFIRGVITAQNPEWGFLVQAQPAGTYRVEAA